MSNEIKIESTFSAYYHEANALSICSQKRYIIAFRWSLIPLIIIALISTLTGIINDNKSAIFTLNLISIALILTSIIATFIVHRSNLQKLWYDGRAVSESLKTMSWKYVCDISKGDVDEQLSSFSQDAWRILNNHSEVYLSILRKTTTSPELISNEMQQIRSWDWQRKHREYLQQRILEQLKWYGMKANGNKKHKNIWFSTVIIFLISAAICMGFVLYYPGLATNLVNLFTTASTAVISWIQVKRYQELHEAYSTTALEIGHIYYNGFNITSRDEFIQYVLDAEKAISREHTLWIARRDQTKLRDLLNHDL
ncbi:DUF4231 domain-containing protein [Mesobacillus maritimus]|uniref:DUF4231 domain-containing protein n=1 Tax=Mesobacillus maritimus TaxID=1643336 RepID=UPI00203AD812|nr:DUF4231 domain-containing protein [Mesobacillus maritimus]MCM3667913.1 DUF4231 domain-containing protein [Mesobacillus maritimus]